MFRCVLHKTRTKELYRFVQNFIMNLHSDCCRVVAVAQMTATNDKEKNFSTFKALVTAAKKQNASVSIITNNIHCTWNEFSLAEFS